MLDEDSVGTAQLRDGEVGDDALADTLSIPTRNKTFWYKINIVTF